MTISKPKVWMNVFSKQVSYNTGWLGVSSANTCLQLNTIPHKEFLLVIETHTI